MSEMLMAPVYQPFFWLVGLLIYAVVVALVAAACGSLVGAVSYLLFRKSPRRPVRLGLPSLMGVSTSYVVFVVMFSLVCWSFFGGFTTPDERLFTPIRPVSEEDIIGVWGLDAKSLELLEDRLGYQISTHTLTLRDDGTFEMVNMPDCWGPAEPSTGGFVCGSGTWEMREYPGEWELFVHFTSLRNYPDGLYTVFDIGGQEPPYYIWVWAGDPDAGMVMVFERQ